MVEQPRNRLDVSKSPYLRQHKDNPVHWWEWCDEAFAEAARSHRPVLLSVGYAACHWCHVMAHESFESESIAGLMNALFVNIKVDREERPDIDHIYMAALHALGEQGGWPLTMFLDADRRPFWGGTYFPPVSRYGRPSFPELLRQVATIYAQDKERITHNTQALTEHLQQRQHIGKPGNNELTTHDYAALTKRIPAAFDGVNGGLNGAPKFPNPTILDLLWRAADSTAQNGLRQPVIKTLKQMTRGGIHDHVGGGFARYAVDAAWLVPHFEKMLYDNAQLLPLLALAAVHAGDTELEEAASGIVTWLSREMGVSGAFASSLDADSEGEEGKYYVWSRSEIESILGGDDARLFAEFYDITNGGNFEGHNIPNRLKGGAADAPTAQRLHGLKEKLLKVRRNRVPPGRDDKVLADWNGLMIVGLVRAGVILEQPHWIEMARHAHDRIRAIMTRDGALAHSWLDGIGVYPAFASDHAAMALASIVLAEASNDAALLHKAAADLEILHAHYADPENGLLAMTHSGSESLIVRPTPLHDDAVPNANGLYAEALVRISAMTGDAKWLERADRIFKSACGAMREAAMAHATLWSAFDLRLHGADIVVAESNKHSLRDAALRIPFHRRIVISESFHPGLPDTHPVTAMAAAAKGRSAVFICQNNRCTPPLFDAEDVSHYFAQAPNI